MKPPTTHPIIHQTPMQIRTPVLTARTLGQSWAGIPGIEVTPAGRLFVVCFSGGPREPAPENTVYLAVSDDGGRTFDPPVVMAAPRDGARAFDPTLWCDPLGRLWLIFNRGNKDTADHAVYARLCADPDAAEPVWMLIRTGAGALWESVSTDGGRSWSEGRPSGIRNPGSRFFIRRLARFTEADVLAGHDTSKKDQVRTNPGRLLPADWNPKAAGDRVLAGLKNVCLPQVKGAHDSDFVIVGGKAYIVYEANDVQPGEQPDWPFVYCALSVVDVASGRVEQTLAFAASETRYDNGTLPVGACFVPHLLQKDERTIRCFFASEDFRAGHEAQTWYRDYDLTCGAFDGGIYRAEIETDQGVFPMQPRAFYQHAAAKGFRGEPTQHGLYLVDSFKRFDGRVHAVLNNFPGGQLAWAVLNPALDRFTVLGDFFLPHEAKLTEAAVNRLPDGSWLAISRQENRDLNYLFAASPDGRTWTPHESRPPVVNGTNSKPVFERFGGIYYLGWNEATQVNGAYRSVFNLDISRDGIHWERKYRFETDKSFQYPTLREYEGAIYLTVTQGDYSDSRKERIMFGKLENLES